MGLYRDYRIHIYIYMCMCMCIYIYISGLFIGRMEKKTETTANHHSNKYRNESLPCNVNPAPPPCLMVLVLRDLDILGGIIVAAQNSKS